MNIENKWTLYDELIEGIPGELRVEDFCVGLTWTAVRADCGWGVSMTVDQTAGPEEPRRRLIGASLREAAALAKSWDFREASIGMAAMNAYYKITSGSAAMISSRLISVEKVVDWASQKFGQTMYIH